jgi:hypothetical protein
MSDDILSYLQGDSRGPKRDMIARCYYEVAQGDPKSGPVAYAVLLDACAEQFAKTPGELREATEYLRLLLAQAGEFERKLRDRVETSNATVIMSFRDETRRAREAWDATIKEVEYVRQRAKLLAGQMEPVIAASQQIASDFGAVKGDLKLHHEYTTKIVDGVEAIKVMHQENQALVKHLTRQARFNWLTLGFLGGIIFDVIASQLQMPQWAGWVVLGLGAGSLQWLYRRASKLYMKAPESQK